MVLSSLVAVLSIGTAAALAPNQELGRRALLRTAASAAAIMPALSPLPAYADATKAAALYQEEDHNVGDASKYTPSVKVDAKGSANSKLAIVLPKPGPISDGDYADCMWFMDSKTFKVVAAEAYGSNGLTSDFSLRADTGVDPVFSARIKTGLTVVPFVHCKKGGTWEGAPFKL